MRGERGEKGKERKREERKGKLTGRRKERAAPEVVLGEGGGRSETRECKGERE